MTDRVETDEKLKRSEALYRTLVEAAPPIIWHADANGDLNYLNKAWVEMTGIAADDALGSKWSQVVHPDDKPGLLAKWEDTRRQGKSMTVECRFRAKDSTYRTIDFVAAPVHSPSGEVIRWVGINTDITDRQQAAEHLARANRRLAMTAEIGKLATSSLELSAVLDAILGGTMTALGAAAGVIFLIKPDTGKLTVAATDGVNSNMEHRLTESLGSDGRGGLTSRVARTGEAIYFRLDAGSDSRAIDKRMNSFIGVPISADDKLLAVMSLSTRAGAVFEPWDFELAKSVAAQVGMVVRNANLVGENFSLAAAIDQSSEVITITDIDGIMRYVNPAFEFITGYSRDEAIGANPSILASGKHGPEHYRELWKTITGGDVWVGRFVNRRKDGTLWEAESTIAPINNKQGRLEGFVEVKRDITEQVVLQKRLLQAQKMEALGRLAGGVAHDFNNLPTVIKGYTDLLLAETGEKYPLREGLGTIKRAAERATDLTGRLLVFSKERPADPTTLNLDDAVRGVEPMLRRLISEDVDLYMMIDSHPWTVDIDPVQLEQVIINLVVNACDAMPSGGQLMLTTSRRGDTEGEIDGSEDATETLELTVRDSGVGMDSDTMDRIFDPFFTTKVGGTGLGLSIVHGIVSESGGTLSIYSEPSSGTSFKVVWPRSVAGKHEGPESAESSAEVVHGIETVLVVEDDPGVCDFMVEVLKRYGYTVLGARTAQEAIETFEGCGEEILMVVTDVVLPGTSGPDLAQHLKALQPELPILFVTGYLGRDVDHAELIDAEVLRKPFDGALLAGTVRRLLDATNGKSGVGLS